MKDLAITSTNPNKALIDSCIFGMRRDHVNLNNFREILAWVRQNKKGIGVSSERLAAMIRQEIGEDK